MGHRWRSPAVKFIYYNRYSRVIDPSGPRASLTEHGMSSCPGRLDGKSHQHAQLVYRCTECGATGCREERCSNNGFSRSGQCNRCGRYQTSKAI